MIDFGQVAGELVFAHADDSYTHTTVHATTTLHDERPNTTCAPGTARSTQSSTSRRRRARIRRRLPPPRPTELLELRLVVEHVEEHETPLGVRGHVSREELESVVEAADRCGANERAERADDRALAHVLADTPRPRERHGVVAEEGGALIAPKCRFGILEAGTQRRERVPRRGGIRAPKGGPVPRHGPHLVQVRRRYGGDGRHVGALGEGGVHLRRDLLAVPGGRRDGVDD